MRQLAGSVGGAVQAREAGMEELAVIAPEELFMDPTATASSRGRGGRGRGRGSGTREQNAAPSQGGRGHGRAGVSEPMEVSQDRRVHKWRMEDGERLRASAFMHAKTQKFANFEFLWRTS
mmetsp:Transcript_9116/g.23101  ORF Transcript_9116/g.23101 Transcript_9116/m.23101 type:complete len:120 (-) Transcript_9116:188-547(-)